jgi:hypothetical protein
MPEHSAEAMVAFRATILCVSGAGTVMRVPILAVTDPRNARILLIVSWSLFAIGVVMLIATIWWWRHSKVEHPALGRLESMNAARAVTAAAPSPVAEAESTSAEPRPAEEPPVIDPLLRPVDADADDPAAADDDADANTEDDAEAADEAVAPGYGGAHG